MVVALSCAGNNKKPYTDIENAVSQAGSSAIANIYLEKGDYNGYYPVKHAKVSCANLSDDWQLAGFDQKFNSPAEIPVNADWILVKKPTSVQMAHFKAGKLPDPYVGMNSKLYEPLEKKIWYYKKKFTPAVAPTKNSTLYFEAVDYLLEKRKK